MATKVLLGDCFLRLREFPEGYFTACVTDPPYELGFMGKSWDKTGIAFSVPMWKLVLKVLKPGAHLFCFGGTRTYHRMACAIEDAGFVLMDCCMWLHGQGFPKNHDISKAIDKAAGAEREVIGSKRLSGNAARSTKEKGGTYASNTNSVGVQAIDVPITAPATDAAKLWHGWGTGLKPAWEPIVIAMKPLDGTYVQNAQVHGVAGLHIDAARIPTAENCARPKYLVKDTPVGFHAERMSGGRGHAEGRFPANLILGHHPDCVYVGTRAVPSKNYVERSTHTDPGFTGGWKKRDGHERGYAKGGEELVEKWECHPDCPIGMLDQQRGELGLSRGTDKGDRGGASRFLYTAKASRKERWYWCDFCSKAFPRSAEEDCAWHRFFCETCNEDFGPKQKSKHEGHKIRANVHYHVTQKPEKIMEYVLSLVGMPENNLILDPFSGSGTTLVVAERLGFDSVGVEKDAKMRAMSLARLARDRDGS